MTIISRRHSLAAGGLSAAGVISASRRVRPLRGLDARRVIASAARYAVSCVRLAPSLLNTPEEVEAALREVRALAAS